MASHLERLVELQSVLTRLEQQRAAHASPPEPIATLQAENEEIDAKVAELTETANNAESERRAAEGSGTDAEEKVKHYESQISQVSTQKEYGALLSEIDAAKEVRTNADDTALAAIEVADTSRAEIETLKERKAEVAQDLNEGLESWEATRPGLAQEIEQLEGQAQTLRELLSPPVASLFERLIVRHKGDPMTRIITIERKGGRIYRCESCNYSVRPQVVVQVQTSTEIVQCDTCDRIYFFDDAEGEAAD